MKKIFYWCFCTAILLPLSTFALTKPEQHDLAGEMDFNTILRHAINFFLGFLASLAVLMIVVSGIMYMTSGGDAQRAETAKKMLTYSITGLIVALLSYVIVYTISRAVGAV